MRRNMEQPTRLEESVFGEGAVQWRAESGGRITLRERGHHSIALCEPSDTVADGRNLASAIGQRNGVAVERPPDVLPVHYSNVAEVQRCCTHADEDLLRARHRSLEFGECEPVEPCAPALDL